MEEKLSRALPKDVPDYHERQAAHFRELASIATTARLKARLLREADQHEQMAHGEPALGVTDEEDIGACASSQLGLGQPERAYADQHLGMIVDRLAQKRAHVAVPEHLIA